MVIVACISFLFLVLLLVGICEFVCFVGVG